MRASDTSQNSPTSSAGGKADEPTVNAPRLNQAALRDVLGRLGSSTTGTARVWALTVVLSIVAVVLASMELPAGQPAQPPVSLPWWLLAALFYVTRGNLLYIFELCGVSGTVDAPENVRREQAAAVQAAFTSRLSIVTGGPGTGKTGATGRHRSAGGLLHQQVHDRLERFAHQHQPFLLDVDDSLTRLRCFGLQALFPGHGKISSTPIEDIDRAIANAQEVLEGRAEGGPEIFYQKTAEH